MASSQNVSLEVQIARTSSTLHSAYAKTGTNVEEKTANKRSKQTHTHA